jgi:hypothetical protein
MPPELIVATQKIPLGKRTCDPLRPARFDPPERQDHDVLALGEMEQRLTIGRRVPARTPRIV